MYLCLHLMQMTPSRSKQKQNNAFCIVLICCKNHNLGYIFYKLCYYPPLLMLYLHDVEKARKTVCIFFFYSIWNDAATSVKKKAKFVVARFWIYLFIWLFTGLLQLLLL